MSITIYSFKDHADNVLSVTFSSNGEFLKVSAGLEVFYWNITKGERIEPNDLPKKD